MKNVLIIGQYLTGCQILARLNNRHTPFYRAVQEGISIVSVDSMDMGKVLDKLFIDEDDTEWLSFTRNAHLIPTAIPSLDHSIARAKEQEQKHRRQQHKWAARNYKK